MSSGTQRDGRRDHAGRRRRRRRRRGPVRPGLGGLAAEPRSGDAPRRPARARCSSRSPTRSSPRASTSTATSGPIRGVASSGTLRSYSHDRLRDEDGGTGRDRPTRAAPPAGGRPGARPGGRRDDRGDLLLRSRSRPRAVGPRDARRLDDGRLRRLDRAAVRDAPRGVLCRDPSDRHRLRRARRARPGRPGRVRRLPGRGCWRPTVRSTRRRPPGLSAEADPPPAAGAARGLGAGSRGGSAGSDPRRRARRARGLDAVAGGRPAAGRAAGGVRHPVGRRGASSWPRWLSAGVRFWRPRLPERLPADAARARRRSPRRGVAGLGHRRRAGISFIYEWFTSGRIRARAWTASEREQASSAFA